MNENTRREVIDTLKQIETKMLANGFKKHKAEKGWRIYVLGDNFFQLTTRFARLEIRNYGGKIIVSAMTASSIKGGDMVSRIDWAETKKLMPENFAPNAKKIVTNLFVNMKGKSVKDEGRQNPKFKF